MENLFEIRLKKFLSEIEKECRVCKIYYKKAKFACFNDSVFTYTVKHDNSMYEFSFICDDTLLSKMTVKELLELKRINSYAVRIFDENLQLISDLDCVNF